MQMTKPDSTFNGRAVRSQYDTEGKEWLFSAVDAAAALVEPSNPRVYWAVLKARLKKNGDELITNCKQLKMHSADGKSYLRALIIT